MAAPREGRAVWTALGLINQAPGEGQGLSRALKASPVVVPYSGGAGQRPGMSKKHLQCLVEREGLQKEGGRSQTTASSHHIPRVGSPLSEVVELPGSECWSGGGISF